MHGPELLRIGAEHATGVPLCAYEDALALMDRLVARSPDAPDALISLQHPPTITLGRRGGRDAIWSTTLREPGQAAVEVPVVEVARGGSVTWHCPGQLVVYPIVQLPRLEGPIGRGPLGDLGRFVRTLEVELVACCAAFGLTTITREGFSGVWIDARTKLASIGVGVRNGWSFHGLALNVCPYLPGFSQITPCALEGVQMTSMAEQLADQGEPIPALAAVEADLVARLQQCFVRRRE